MQIRKTGVERTPVAFRLTLADVRRQQIPVMPDKRLLCFPELCFDTSSLQV